MNKYAKFLSIALVTCNFYAHALDNVAFYVACTKDPGNSDKSIQIGLTNAAGEETKITLSPGQYKIVSLSHEIRTITYYLSRSVPSIHPLARRIPPAVIPVLPNNEDKIAMYEFDANAPALNAAGDGFTIRDLGIAGQLTQEELRERLADYQRVR